MKFKIIFSIFLMFTLACSAEPNVAQQLNSINQKLQPGVEGIELEVAKIASTLDGTKKGLERLDNTTQKIATQFSKDLQEAVGEPELKTVEGEFPSKVAGEAKYRVTEKFGRQNLIKLATKIRTQPIASLNGFKGSESNEEEIKKVGRWFKDTTANSDMFYIEGEGGVLKINLKTGALQICTDYVNVNTAAYYVSNEIPAVEVASKKDIGILKELFSVKTPKGRKELAALALRSCNPLLDAKFHLHNQSSKAVGSWFLDIHSLREALKLNIHSQGFKRLYIKGFDGFLRVRIIDEHPDKFHYKLTPNNLDENGWEIDEPFLNLEKLKKKGLPFKGSQYFIKRVGLAGRIMGGDIKWAKRIQNLIDLAVRRKQYVDTPNVLARSRPDKTVSAANRKEEGIYSLIGKFTKATRKYSKKNYIVISGYDGLLVIKSDGSVWRLDGFDYDLNPLFLSDEFWSSKKKEFSITPVQLKMLTDQIPNFKWTND